MDPEIYERVRQLTVEELGVPEHEVMPDAHFLNDLGASLDVLELFMACEEEFHIDIPDEDVGECRTPAELATYITKKLGKTPPEGDASQIISGYPRPRPKSR